MDRVARCAVLARTDLVLTEREFDVLLYLADHADRVVRRAELLEQIWNAREDGSNVVAVCIYSVRRKLGLHARMLTTIRSVGYRLRPNP